MNTVTFAMVLWVVLAAIFAAYLGLVGLVSRAHRIVAERDWGRW